MTDSMNERDTQMRAMRRAGMTLIAIAKVFGITKQRVFQIVDKRKKKIRK